MHTSPLCLFVSIQTKDLVHCGTMIAIFDTKNRLFKTHHTNSCAFPFTILRSLYYFFISVWVILNCRLLFLHFFWCGDSDILNVVRRYICNKLNYRSIPLTLRMLGTPSGLTQPCSQITTLRLSAGVTSYMKLTTVVFGTSLQPARCCPAPPPSVLTSKSGGPGEDDFSGCLPLWWGKGRW